MKLPHRVSVVNAPLVTGEYQNEVRDWDNATVTVREAFWQPRTGGGDAEDTEGADIQFGDGLVWFPIDAPVDGHSRLTVAHLPGQVFEVLGPPAKYVTGRPTDHLRAVVRSVEG